jgi:glycine betaine catabolism A
MHKFYCMNFNNESITELLQSQQLGKGLDSVFYCSQELFVLETDAIFRKQWVLAGHKSQLKPNSYLSLEINNESVLLSMDGSGNVYAHFNICRHRGCTLGAKELTVSKKIVCPYHSWQYALDGSLLMARGMPESFELSSYNLKACGVRIFDGLIFLNLSSLEDEGFNRALADASYFFKPLHIADTKVVVEKSWNVKANWKLLVENFEECYHCLSLHPEYSRVMAHARPESTGSTSEMQLWEQNRKNWDDTLSKMSRPYGWISPDKDSLHFCARVPFNKGIFTQSMDGRLVSSLLGNQLEPDGGSTSFRIYPTSFIIACPDYVILINFSALTSKESIVNAKWLVSSNAKEGIDYHVDTLTELWSITIEQDNWAVELTQPRVSSMAYEPGPFSESEEYSSIFVQWYLKKMRNYILPEATC